MELDRRRSMASFTLTFILVLAVLSAAHGTSEQQEQADVNQEGEQHGVTAEKEQVNEVKDNSETQQAEKGPEDRDNRLLECYDFVIVGGGSAGSLVANRLSANGTYTVLVIEAGDEETPDLSIPFLSPFIKNVNNSWIYLTTPQEKACLSFPNRTAVLTLGKILGGTSSINSMNYARGSKHDFDSWERQYGANGWTYNEILPMFKKIELFNISGVPEAEKYHGFSGDIPINYASYNTQLSYAFLNACEQAGYSYIDYNGETHMGVSRVQANIAFGARMSANTCFLKNVRKERENLHISLNSMATKIAFDGEKLATDVFFTVDGVNMSVKVGREVVVCAGAIGSPKLLMLSGIGPEAELEKHKIPLVADLPVGKGLQDHVIFIGVVVTTNEDLIGLREFNQSYAQYLCNQTGLFTIPGAFESLLFTSSGEAGSEADDADIELELTDLFPDPRIKQSPYVSDEIYEKYYKPMFNKSGFMTAIAMVQPKSRGTVTLITADPNVPPLIDPKMFDQDEDLERLVNGTLKIMGIFNTTAMQNVGAEVWKGKYPNCDSYEVWTPEYVKCFIQNAAFPGQHVCCTCAMGNGSNAVVNERLRVQGGVKNVRVADASVMPQITSANTYAPVMMIAEMAAEMIIADAVAANKPAQQN